jgi:PAS domain S-box-containing protein
MEKAKILIVEDEAIIAMELESQLQSLGYEVTSIVDTGERAIQKAEVDKPDIILMDIRIKGEIDGIETAEIIRNRFGIPFIFSTAYLDQGRIERAKITMPFGYVLKPIQERDLKVTLEMALYVSKVDKKRLLAEEELRKSQFLFTEMFEQSTTSIQLFDPDGYCLRVNSKFCKMFGVHAEDIIDRKYNILKDQNLMSPRITKLVEGIFNEKRVNRWEGQYDIGISADLFGIATVKRKQIDIDTLGYPILDNSGQLKYVAFHTHDITERKQAEKALRESEFFFSQMFEQSSTATCLYNPNGLVLRVNPEFCKMFGVDEKVITDGRYNVFEDQAAKAAGVIPLMKRIFENKKTNKSEFSFDVDLSSNSTGTPTSKAGRIYLDVFGYPILDDEGELKYVVLQHYDITERKQSEEALRESEEKYKVAFKTSPDALNINRLDGLYVSINEGFTKITGFLREDVIGKFSSEINIWAIPEDREKLIAGLKQNGYFENLESTFRFKDGRCIVGLMSASLITLNNEPHILSITRDITERKQAETALKESQHRLTTHREMTPMGVIEFNNAFEIISWNPAAEKIFGYTMEEAVGCNSFDILVPEYEKSNVRKIHLLSKSEPTENINENTTKDGKVITCQWYNTPILDINGELVGMTAVCQDITDKLKTEQEIKLLRIRLDNIFNSMPSVLIGIDMNGKITDWNYKAIEATGISINDAIGKTFSEVLPEYKDHVNKINTAIGNKQSEFVKKVVRQVGDVVCYEDVTIYPLIANGLEGAVIRIDDVTELVRLEKVIIQTEKMMSVGGLAAGMAHELNNPLGGMLQGVQNIQRRLSSDLESNLELAKETGIDLHNLQSYMEKRGIHSFISGIQESGKKASQIISSMLQFSRKSESSLAPNDLTELMNNVLELAGKDYDLNKRHDFRNIKIIKEFDTNLPQVSCTETEIEQVFLNLLNNAAWAMLNERKNDPPQIIIRIHVENRMVRIEVEDNGPGMEGAVRKRIFEPFFTTKPVGEGTGLGLSVSYMIITSNHNGTMEVESEIGKGTKFIIQLPLNRELAS